MQPVINPPIEILHLYISPGHNYFGRHGMAPGTHETHEVQSIHCVAGKGIEGDRFCNMKSDYKGQITFFAQEVYESLQERCDVHDIPPSAFRRNVITRGVDLNSLIGEEFDIQGVRFRGASECSPCYWMNQAFHPDALQLMRGRGGLRARILESGWINRS